MQGGRTLRIVRWGLPILAERATPDAEIENFHYDVGDRDINGSTFDNEALLEILSESPVEKEEARFGPPLNSAHALLNQKNSLGSPRPPGNLLGGQFDRVCGINQIRRDIQVNVEKGNENGVQALQ